MKRLFNGRLSLVDVLLVRTDTRARALAPALLGRGCLVRGLLGRGGLGEAWLAEDPERCLEIPVQNPQARSLNLSNCVALVLYEALRQQGFGEDSD